MNKNKILIIENIFFVKFLFLFKFIILYIVFFYTFLQNLNYFFNSIILLQNICLFKDHKFMDKSTQNIILSTINHYYLHNLSIFNSLLCISNLELQFLYKDNM